jgi:hypothetical protein
MSIEYPFGDGQLTRLRELAEVLARLKLEVIVNVDTPPSEDTGPAGELIELGSRLPILALLRSH